MKQFLKTLLVAGVLSTSAAHAGLIGDTVGTEYVGASGVQTSVVGAGAEGNFFGNQIYDYDDFSFSIRSTSGFCGINACGGQPISLSLTSLDFGAPLSNVTFTSLLSGVSVTFGADFATFTWNEQALPADTYLTATFEAGNRVDAVPEPVSLALLLTGLAGLGFARRQRAA